MPPLWGFVCDVTFFYRDAVAMRLKRPLKFSGFLRKIRRSFDADRMNQRYEGSPYGIPRGVYAAKQRLLYWGPRRLLFLKLTLMVVFIITT